jgi:hypothetical protein
MFRMNKTENKCLTGNVPTSAKLERKIGGTR